jgi:hypothetical protein
MIVYLYSLKAYNQQPVNTLPSGGASPMDQSFIDHEYEGFNYEKSRKGPPEDFPALPVKTNVSHNVYSNPVNPVAASGMPFLAFRPTGSALNLSPNNCGWLPVCRV